MLPDVRARSIQNLLDSVVLDAKIPHRVIAEEFRDIFVMDYQGLLAQTTIDLVKMLLKYEGSTTAVLAQLASGSRQQPYDWRDDVFFVTPDTGADVYWSFIRRNWKAHAQKEVPPNTPAPWSVFAWTIGACSDAGQWCIVGQFTAEIALLGFKRSPGLFFERKLHSDFRVERLEDALKRDTFFGEPGNEVSKRQRAILRDSYLR
jgi:hypothetical protein